MICKNCAKLNINNSIKKCVKCKIEIYLNLQIICSACATEDNVCSICLKKMSNKQLEIPKLTGCNCGK